jgi:cobalt/nickel transport protein
MRKKLVWLWGLLMAMVWAVTFPGAAGAHFQIFWPQVEGCYGKPGEVTKWRYVWGHPFEMILYDAQPPKFFMFTPQGKKDKVTLKEITMKDGASGKERKAYEVEYTPAAPGDYYLCLEAPPYFISEEKVFWQDYVKEPWHVMAQKGWDKPVGLDLEIVPLTRPYGWPAGSVFKAQALFKGKPLKGGQVDVEKFNGFYVPKDRLPKDRLGEENEPLMSRVTKIDGQGYLTCTLDSPGWWVISVGHEDGKKSWEGKSYPVEKRGCLWIYVEPTPAPPVK